MQPRAIRPRLSHERNLKHAGRNTAATGQRILWLNPTSVTTGTYIEVVGSVQREAVDRAGGLFDDSERAAE
ncbi:hypothetical protein GCM10010185_05230 [Saccharothrix coeruleofusca]|uniref:Uncharacterized protein n=1 Tax=Saccharothrix coeruleofusca TaxID=33919 RepID=A0A918AH88_9PSEU|nr:hypothetical protein GCM10010185_05230 [Saccharothrix coeruleofusca]